MRGFFNDDDGLSWSEVAKYAVLAVVFTICFMTAVAGLPLLADAFNHVINIRSAAIPCEGLLIR